MKKKTKKTIFENPELQEEYIQIYVLRNLLKVPWWELQEKFKCSKRKLQSALSWVKKYYVKVPPKELLRGSIFAIETRIRKNTEMWLEEHKKDDPSIRNIIELNREIREDQKYLDKLQAIYKEGYEIDLEAEPSTAKFLEELTKKGKE